MVGAQRCVPTLDSLPAPLPANTLLQEQGQWFRWARIACARGAAGFAGRFLCGKARRACRSVGLALAALAQCCDAPRTCLKASCWYARRDPPERLDVRNPPPGVDSGASPHIWHSACITEPPRHQRWAALWQIFV